MITITHYQERDGWAVATVKHSDFRLYSGATASYALGYEKPHYPVPAIPLACAIHSNVVQIAECDWFEGELFFNLVAEYDRE